ncbi:MAG: trehalose-6-phosphate synthase, partial [Actinobacteria bacterium]|nr:trehalose-6-phosphate synthase [Actinomycetota bacterium]
MNVTAAPQVVAPLVIASNRGPVELRADADDHIAQHRGAGGLIAVLGPAAAAARGLWVASAITEHDIQAARRANAGTMEVVNLPEGRVRVRMIEHEPSVYHDYYGTVSTELLWFLQHHLFDLSRGPVVDSRLRNAWCNYRRVNNDIAAACAAHAAAHSTVLLPDYHLSLAPRRLRSLRPDVRSAHFTMPPWADPDYFSILPKDLRRELVSGLLGADMVCFLVPRWAEAFLECCTRLGLTVDPHRSEVLDEEGRSVAVRCFAVGVDADELSARAAGPEVAEYRNRLSARMGNRQLVLRIDRMEPAKNVLR